MLVQFLQLSVGQPRHRAAVLRLQLAVLEIIVDLSPDAVVA
jgi:hypothetical protein